MYSMAILCGGLGTRLGELAKDTPKCLMDVNGRPFLEYILERVWRQGITRVVLCTGHLGDQIEAYVTDGLPRMVGLEITLSRETSPLGTAGALTQAAMLLGEDYFVLYGDSYPGVDLSVVQDAYEQTDAAAMMVVCDPPPGYKPNVWLVDNKIYAHEKRWRPAEANYIDYGLGVVNRDAFRKSCDYSDLSDYYGDLASNGDLAGYVSPERFYTIGTPESLALTREFLGERVLR